MPHVLDTRMKRTLTAVLCLVTLAAAEAQERVKRELRANHAPAEMIKAALDGALSESGKYIMLPNKGTVVVIDTADRIAAAQTALAQMEIPAPQVATSFAFRGGVAAGNQGARIVDATEFIFPIEWEPARIIVNGQTGGVVTVIPATPTKFAKRNVGTTLETRPTINADGSIALDVNYENTEFDGFINYGSGIFIPGQTGTVPVNANVPNPQFFSPFINSGSVQVPIFSTTRVSTSIILRPAVSDDLVTFDMVPQLTVHDTGEPGAEEITVNLVDFRTEARVRNNQTGKVNGFTGASADFNRHFLGIDPDMPGGTAIMIKPHISSGAIDPETHTSAVSTPESEEKLETQ